MPGTTIRPRQKFSPPDDRHVGTEILDASSWLHYHLLGEAETSGQNNSRLT